jgi:uncharacterized protein YpuA (DUF1002 family)
MSKSYFFFGQVRTHPEDDVRISRGKDYQVQGGSKAAHEKAVEVVQEISKEFKKDPPQTPGETRMILQEVVKRVR